MIFSPSFWCGMMRLSSVALGWWCRSNMVGMLGP